jgi:hypothetical protein
MSRMKSLGVVDSGIAANGRSSPDGRASARSAHRGTAAHKSDPGVSDHKESL